MSCTEIYCHWIYGVLLPPKVGHLQTYNTPDTFFCPGKKKGFGMPCLVPGVGAPYIFLAGVACKQKGKGYLLVQGMLVLWANTLQKDVVLV